jgi:SAM-dependent methyltransferase
MTSSHIRGVCDTGAMVPNDICRICGHTGGAQVFVVREMMFGLREEFHYFQCPSCRCLQIRDIPADMSPYYPANYYSLNAELAEPGHGLARAAVFLESRFRRHVSNRVFGRSRRTRIFDWMRRTQTGYRSSILDVGCGRAKLLHELCRFGFRDLTGADPFVAGELRYANGIVVHKCELAQLERRFDLIMMHHTLEHVADQQATLSAAFERLRAGRFLLLRVPLVDCEAWRQYGVSWFAIDAPRHFYLHTERSIRVLADKTGFEVVSTEYDSGAHQFWGSEQYLRDIPHRSPASHEENPKGSLFTRKQIAQFEQRSLALNAKRQGDAACFYLRRR